MSPGIRRLDRVIDRLTNTIEQVEELSEEIKRQQRYIDDLEHLIELIRNFYPGIEEMPLYKELFE